MLTVPKALTFMVSLFQKVNLHSSAQVGVLTWLLKWGEFLRTPTISFTSFKPIPCFSTLPQTSLPLSVEFPSLGILRLFYRMNFGCLFFVLILIIQPLTIFQNFYIHSSTVISSNILLWVVLVGL